MFPLKRYEETSATYDNVRTGDRVIVGWWAPVEYIIYRYKERIRVAYDQGASGGINMTAEEFDAYGYLKVPPGGLIMVLPISWIVTRGKKPKRGDTDVEMHSQTQQ